MDEKNSVQEEKKVVVTYIVKRYDNGDVNVENADVEGTERLSSEALYKDVEDLADMIKYRRIENAAYRGIQRFYVDAQTVADKEQAVDPTV